MAKVVYAVIKIEITAEEKDINENELELSDKVDELQSKIEELIGLYSGDKLQFRLVPEWELDDD